MMSIDWPKLINWIVSGLITFVFSALIALIVHSLNKKRERETKKEESDLDQYRKG